MKIFDLYEEFYKNDTFVKICDNGFAEIQNVVYTNNVNISFHLGPNKKLTIISAIDNLIKGAAGQAVQNMNIMMGYDETTALKNE